MHQCHQTETSFEFVTCKNRVSVCILNACCSYESSLTENQRSQPVLGTLHMDVPLKHTACSGRTLMKPAVA